MPHTNLTRDVSQKLLLILAKFELGILNGTEPKCPRSKFNASMGNPPRNVFSAEIETNFDGMLAHPPDLIDCVLEVA